MKRGIIAAAVVLLLMSLALTSCSLLDSKNTKIKDDAKGQVKSFVYRDLGIVADRFDADILYQKDNKSLVFVKFYKGSYSPMGSYCLYYYTDVCLNSTAMLPSEYSGQAHLEELKALFGVM